MAVCLQKIYDKWMEQNEVVDFDCMVNELCAWVFRNVMTIQQQCVRLPNTVDRRLVKRLLRNSNSCESLNVNADIVKVQ